MERAWRERPSYVHLCYCSETRAESLFLSPLWFIFSWRVDYLLRLIWALIRSDQKLNPAACLTLSQEIMACRLLIGRAGRSHFHFVLTVRVPGMFLLHNNDKIYSYTNSPGLKSQYQLSAVIYLNKEWGNHVPIKPVPPSPGTNIDALTHSLDR